MLAALHGIIGSGTGLAAYGGLAGHYILDAPTSLTDTAQANTVEVNTGVTTFKSLYDFSGNNRRLLTPVLANRPIMDTTVGSAVFDGNRWFSRLTIAGVPVRTIAIKIKGIPSPLTTLNQVGMFSSSPGFGDCLFLGNATSSFANETITFLPADRNTSGDMQYTTTMPPDPWFTLVLRPYSRKIALNGVDLALTSMGSVARDGTFDLSIGLRPLNSGKFTGEIQEFALWTTEVADADILAIHNIIK